MAKRIRRKVDEPAKRDEEQILAEEAKAKPELLTPDEFRSVLQKVKTLGLTWTTDVPPRLEAKPDAESALFSDEIQKVQRAYPNFPAELGVVVWYILTGAKTSAIAGSQKFLEEKAIIVRETALISHRYRSEFFFKYAIKVPYFSDLDWEVIVKTYERNVQEMPGMAYALLSLHFDNPGGRFLSGSSSQTLTVAVDEYLAEKLIKSLSDVKRALEKSRGVTSILREQVGLKEKSDAIANSSEHLGQGKRPSS